ncbi:S1 RNA-binding domain-containing protein [Streptomyces virginiae]
MYSLLEQALAKVGKEGIATLMMSPHEYLVALKAENGLVGRFGYSDVRNRVWAVTYPLPSKALNDFLMTLHPGDVVAGVVAGIENFGVFVDLDGAPEASAGFIHPWRLWADRAGQRDPGPGHEAGPVRDLREARRWDSRAGAPLRATTSRVGPGASYR